MHPRVILLSRLRRKAILTSLPGGRRLLTAFELPGRLGPLSAPSRLSTLEGLASAPPAPEWARWQQPPESRYDGLPAVYLKESNLWLNMQTHRFSQFGLARVQCAKLSCGYERVPNGA
jgi:hypothetical protein